MRKFSAPILGLLAFWVSSAWGASSLQLPTPVIETLPNGLKIAWFVGDQLPVIDLSVLIQAGDRDDLPGKSGTAELLSACLDRGAAGMSAQEIAHAAEMLGASRAAGSDGDSFSIGLHGLAPDAPALLDLLGKIVVHPDFPPAEVTREKERILDARGHLGDYGEMLADVTFNRIISSGSVYGRGGMLSSEELKKVDRDDILAYYKKNFTPGNAVLMIVGRVNPAEFRPKILQAFGGWAGSPPASGASARGFTDARLGAAAFKRTTLKKPSVVLVDRADLSQAQVRIGFVSPSVKSPDHYALTVANALLGEYFNSRLNSLIRDKLGLTYSIASSFSYQKDLAYFSIGSATQNESVGQLIRKTLEVLSDLKVGEIPADEVAMAKDYLLGSFPLVMSTLSSTASRWLAGYIFDLGPNYLNEYIPRVREVTASQVASAVARDFDLDHLVIVVAGDAKQIGKSLATEKIPVARTLTLKDLL